MTAIAPEGYAFTGRRTRQMTAFDRYKRSMSPHETVRISSGIVHPSLVARTHTTSRRMSCEVGVSSTRHDVQKPHVQNRKARAVAIGLLVVISLIAVIMPASKAFGRRSLVSSERSNASLESRVESVVVEQGDTLWSIAEKLEPNKDPRETVDQLVKARGTTNLYVGETIEWTR